MGDDHHHDPPTRPPPRHLNHLLTRLQETAGSRTVTTAPPSGGPFRRSAVPAWAVSTARTMDRPSPAPVLGVRDGPPRTNRSNAASSRSGGKPGPAPAPATRASPGRGSPGPGAVGAPAAALFAARLVSP